MYAINILYVVFMYVSYGINILDYVYDYKYTVTFTVESVNMGT